MFFTKMIKNSWKGYHIRSVVIIPNFDFEFLEVPEKVDSNILFNKAYNMDSVERYYQEHSDTSILLR
ncbi:hypothetical protein AQUCO_01300663v1 [Aquilegia coerulea]|uniref:Uncharacterized protein n=1 Tax=Aquilegia coerulea TaxID=218851 RepID=A0A2G5E2U4_AQUCA|nr:hypothetical protein AQUCO_01300663v1 [Aquilegia coerulea]